MFSHRFATAGQLLAGLGQQQHGLVHLMGLRQHRQQDLQVAVDGSPQERPQLHQEHLGLGQAVADGTPPQGRRGTGNQRLGGQDLVGAHVDGADGDGPALQGLQHLAVSAVLFFLVRQLAAVQEEELGPEEPDALGPRTHGILGLLGPLDVGQHGDAAAILGDAVHIGQLRQQALPLGRLALAFAILFQQRLVGPDDHLPGVTVQNEEVAIADAPGRIIHAGHGRHTQAARQNGRV